MFCYCWDVWPSINCCISPHSQVRVRQKCIYSEPRCPSVPLVCACGISARHLCVCRWSCSRTCVFPMSFNSVCPSKRSKSKLAQAVCCITPSHGGGKCTDGSTLSLSGGIHHLCDDLSACITLKVPFFVWVLMKDDNAGLFCFFFSF